MKRVKITHPDLDGRVIEVAETSVSQHARAGWVTLDEAQSTAEVPPVAETPESIPSRRSRTSPKE